MISIRLRRLYRRLSYFTAFLRDFRPGMQTFIPLSFKASRSQSASYPRSPQEPIRLWQATQQRRRAGVIAHLSGRHEEPDRAAHCVSNGM
jgi:hypothetical protein